MTCKFIQTKSHFHRPLVSAFKDLVWHWAVVPHFTVTLTLHYTIKTLPVIQKNVDIYLVIRTAKKLLSTISFLWLIYFSRLVQKLPPWQPTLLCLHFLMKYSNGPINLKINIVLLNGSFIIVPSHIPELYSWWVMRQVLTAPRFPSWCWCPAARVLGWLQQLHCCGPGTHSVPCQQQYGMNNWTSLRYEPDHPHFICKCRNLSTTGYEHGLRTDRRTRIRSRNSLRHLKRCMKHSAADTVVICRKWSRRHIMR